MKPIETVVTIVPIAPFIINVFFLDSLEIFNNKKYKIFFVIFTSISKILFN